MTKIKDCCGSCGRYRYKPVRESGAITMRYGKCQFCGKEKPIIPASDWLYMVGGTDKWVEGEK